MDFLPMFFLSFVLLFSLSLSRNPQRRFDYDMGKLCQKVYLGSKVGDTIHGMVSTYQMKEQFNGPGLTLGFFAESSKDCVFVFRGTHNILNVIQDLDVAVNYFLWTYVHRGFYNIFSAMLENNQVYRNAIQQCQRNSKTLTWTGHSMGAAIAVLGMAHAMHQLYVPNPNLVTFGEPRIALGDPIKGVDAVSTRYVHVKGSRWLPLYDPITVLPCAHHGHTLLCLISHRCWKHSSSAFTIEDTGDIKYHGSEKEPFLFPPFNFLTNGLFDVHHITGYLLGLERSTYQSEQIGIDNTTITHNTTLEKNSTVV